MKKVNFSPEKAVRNLNNFINNVWILCSIFCMLSCVSCLYCQWITAPIIDCTYHHESVSVVTCLFSSQGEMDLWFDNCSQLWCTSFLGLAILAKCLASALTRRASGNYLIMELDWLCAWLRCCCDATRTITLAHTPCVCVVCWQTGSGMSTATRFATHHTAVAMATSAAPRFTHVPFD